MPLKHDCRVPNAEIGRDGQGDFCMGCGFAYPRKQRGTVAWQEGQGEPQYPILSEVLNPADLQVGGSLAKPPEEVARPSGQGTPPSAKTAPPASQKPPRRPGRARKKPSPDESDVTAGEATGAKTEPKPLSARRKPRPGSLGAARQRHPR